MNNKRMKILLAIQIISLVLMVLLFAGGIYYLIEHRYLSYRVIDISNKVTNLQLKDEELNEKIELKNLDVYIPQKNIDYFDGKDGKNGTDGIGINGKDGVSIKGDKGDSGKDAYIELNCNEVRNRWEVRFSPTESWQLLNGKSTKCTIVEI